MCLLTLLIITLSIYRKWRAEQEIEGLLWRINPEYLEGYHAMQSYPSKQSLASGRSADSCFMNGREDGRYKGRDFFLLNSSCLHFELDMNAHC